MPHYRRCGIEPITGEPRPIADEYRISHVLTPGLKPP
jgi:hypothetical protein